MNSIAPPQKAPGNLASKAALKPITHVRYVVVTALAYLFGAVFWFFEQRRGQLADRLDNERSTQ